MSVTSFTDIGIVASTYELIILSNSYYCRLVTTGDVRSNYAGDLA